MVKINPIRALRRCNLCNEKVEFQSIEDGLGKTLREEGFPFSLADFETLSYKTYSCPNCSSSDRDRMYKLYIDKFENITKKTKILDFAPPARLESYLRSQSNEYRSADLYAKGVDDKVDITNMSGYKDNMFDFFICSHVLEHVSDDQKAMSELNRVLKPSGRGILMTPIINKVGIQDESVSVTNKKERIRRFAQEDHVRLYERKEFINRIKKAGFIVKVYRFWDLGIIDFLKNGITFKSRLYVVSKGK